MQQHLTKSTMYFQFILYSKRSRRRITISIDNTNDKRYGKLLTMMVFGKPLRSSEILKIWSQHHGIEQFWQNTPNQRYECLWAFPVWDSA